MFQITDGTFAAARRYCIHDHVVVEDGPWHDPQSCWFNALYFRVVPSHAIEMTAAFLDASVSSVKGSPRQKREMAAVIHLCGATAGEAFARRGFRPAPRERCGEHDLAAYLSRVAAMTREFARIRGHADL